jgi:hypothetical protein
MGLDSLPHFVIATEAVPVSDINRAQQHSLQSTFHTQYQFLNSLSLQIPPNPLSLHQKMAGNPTEPLTGNPASHNKTDTLVGSCLCGSIIVTITDPELWTKKRGHLCHCANCRKVAGAAYGCNLIIEEEKVKIVDRDGTKKEFLDFKTFTGKPVKRNFCGVDGK